MSSKPAKAEEEEVNYFEDMEPVIKYVKPAAPVSKASAKQPATSRLAAVEEESWVRRTHLPATSIYVMHSKLYSLSIVQDETPGWDDVNDEKVD